MTDQTITSAAEAVVSQQDREAEKKARELLFGDTEYKTDDFMVTSPDGGVYIKASHALRSIMAALATRCAEPEGGETGWLIEHGKSPTLLYWTGESWGKWSGDHKKACRFARREDAHKVSLSLGDPTDWPTGHRVVEHAWSPK